MLTLFLLHLGCENLLRLYAHQHGVTNVSMQADSDLHVSGDSYLIVQLQHYLCESCELWGSYEFNLQRPNRALRIFGRSGYGGC